MEIVEVALSLRHRVLHEYAFRAKGTLTAAVARYNLPGTAIWIGKRC
jgi:hypothetical protein